MEKYTWQAWIGKKVAQCYSMDDGRVYIELEDGRGAIFSEVQNYTATKNIDPMKVAETKI